ncbi:MAG TPA: GAF domain-containing sensor histidine kinase [Kofleriaceae bacterium]|jgi:signal transduction histidine kinase
MITASDLDDARASFLSHASELISSSLAYEETLSAIVRAPIPVVADWCAVDLVDGERVTPGAIAHVDAGPINRALLPHQHPDASDVIRSGEPAVYADGSTMLAPIRHHGQTLGVITLVSALTARNYTQDDVAMAVQLGTLAGNAIANARLYESALKAVEVNELFSGIIGHDLRNPLAAIMATTETLLWGCRSEEDTIKLERIKSSSQRMERMIDQLLDFTRIRAGGGIPSAPEPTDVGTITRLVLDELRELHRARVISLMMRGELIGIWDPDRLGQVLSNLIANALVHGEPGVPVTVELDGTHRDLVTIEVSNGGSIAAELLPALFEPFHGRAYKRDRSAGLGLGLYIVRNIVRLYDGLTEVITTDPRRTTFKVTLPRGSTKKSHP